MNRTQYEDHAKRLNRADSIVHRVAGALEGEISDHYAKSKVTRVAAEAERALRELKGLLDIAACDMCREDGQQHWSPDGYTGVTTDCDHSNDKRPARGMGGAWYLEAGERIEVDGQVREVLSVDTYLDGRVTVSFKGSGFKFKEFAPKAMATIVYREEA